MKSPLYPAVLVGCAMLATSCNEPKVDYSALEQRISDLEEAVNKDKKATSALRNDFEIASKQMERSRDALQLIHSETQALRDDLASAQQEFDKYRDTYREWIFKRGPGMKLGDVALTDRSFRNVVVKSVNDWEVVFLHDGGVARLTLADAPKQLQEKFAFRPGIPKPVKTPVVLGAAPLAGLPDAPTATDTGTASPTAPATASSGQPVGAPPAQQMMVCPVTGHLIPVHNSGMRGASNDKPEMFTSCGFGSSGGSGTKGFSQSQMPPGYKPIGSNFTGSDLSKKK